MGLCSKDGVKKERISALILNNDATGYGEYKVSLFSRLCLGFFF